jgi:phenylacetate-CoA ligase
MHSDLLNPEYRNWARFLVTADKWDSQKIAEYQLAEVKRVVTHAYDTTRGYRTLFDRLGLAPGDIQSLESIRSLPFVEKETIRDALDDFSVAGENRTKVTTGGSTGIPFAFYRADVSFSRELASKAHQYHRIGWQEGDRQLVFRGIPISASDHIEYVPQFEELRCSSYHLTHEVMETYYQRALEYQPQWIRCYPSSGHIFAEFLKETRRRIPSLKGVLCASENLYDFQKRLMSEVFGVRIFSHYGHFELSALAGFCEYEDTYHVLPQYGLTELLDTRGNEVTKRGDMGEIVATSFLMSETPFIRYRTRDFAVLKDCECRSCGRPYQIWERIEGRLQEFVITKTGRMISLTAINMHDDTFDCVRQFQFRQSEAGRLTLNYIPKPTCDTYALEKMQSKLLAKFGDDVELEAQPVSDIAPTQRGKHRFLIQDLTLKYGDR